MQDIERYIDIICASSIDEAELYMKNTMPDKIYKYTNLSDRGIIQSKLDTLANRQLWISNLKELNDPTELGGPLFGRTGLPDEINQFMEIIVQTTGIICFSSNKPTRALPMWAHYSNNHTGIAIEYCKSNHEIAPYNDLNSILPVIYNSNRRVAKLDIAELIKDFYAALDKRKILKDSAELKETIQKLMMLIRLHFFNKHISWDYEKEYRIVSSLTDSPSIDERLKNSLVPERKRHESLFGLKSTAIYLGINFDTKSRIYHKIHYICKNNNFKLIKLDNDTSQHIQLKEKVILS